MSAPEVPQVLEGFLKEFLGAKKAIRLYPAGNPLAAEWIQRLHRSYEHARRDGLPPAIRIANGRFEWDGGHLTTRDHALDAFRFELETRRINEIAIEPGVEPWEFRDLLECLNMRQDAVDAGGGLPALLGERNVTHIVLRGLFWGDRSGAEEAGAPSLAAARIDLVDAFVAAVLALLEQEFRELTDDRQRLGAWFRDLAGPEERADVVFAALEMLIPLVEAEPDRELRYRTLAEAVVGLPDPVRTALATVWLVPRAWIPDVLNLLTRFTGEELGVLTRLVPAEVLGELRASLAEMPASDWRKARLTETLEESLALREGPEEPPEPLIADDDPALGQLATAVRNACAPEAVVSHSMDVFFQLLGTHEAPNYPATLADALEEAIGEALARDQLRLALRALRALNNTARIRPEWIADHQRRLHLLNRRLSGRSYVSLLAELLRRGERPDTTREAAEYLSLLSREAAEEFVAILVDHEDADTRARMLDVLAAVGPSAVAVIRPRVGDHRWAVARQMIAFLARLGDASALPAIEKVIRHEHPQVRREVARALAALGGPQAMRPLLEYLQDPDSEVRLVAIKLVGSLMDASAVEPLREFLATPTRGVADLRVKREVIGALATIGSAESRQVLSAIAQRRVWFWRRAERTVQDLAREALQGAKPAAETERG